MGAYSLATTVRAATTAEAADLDPGKFVARMTGADAAYPAALVASAYSALTLCARETKIRAAFVAAQIAKETGNFRFGGQVRPEQFNWAGLGATNDGAAGLNLTAGSAGAATLDALVLRAVRAVFAHHCNYLFGPFERWPAEIRAYAALAFRHGAVVGAGYGGVVKVIGDYTNGRWAYTPTIPRGSLDNGYARGIVEIANTIRAEQTGVAMGPRIAIAAGHHNTDGGDAYEIAQTGDLAYEAIRQLRAAGFDVIALTRDDGRGMEPVGLQAVARKVNGLRPLPTLFLELHTEGNGATGVFAIYPNKGGDYDEEVHKTLGPLMARRVAARTGLGVRAGGGVMPETATAVGSQGADRLGIFYATTAVKADVTRMILEVGAHDKEPDLSISKQPGFAARAGAGIVDALRVWTGYDNGVDTLASGAAKAPVAPAGEGGSVRNYVDPATGEPVTEIRWGGRAHRLDVNLVDLGVAAYNDDEGTVYYRSIQGNQFGGYDGPHRQ